MVDVEQVVRLQENLAALGELSHSLRMSSRLNKVLRAAQSQSNDLTERERAILVLIANGRDNGEIAREMHYGIGTIKMHVREILLKLEATSRTEAAVRAVRLRLI